MSSVICFNSDQTKILSSGNGIINLCQLGQRLWEKKKCPYSRGHMFILIRMKAVRLIERCLTPFATVFQLYHGGQWTYPCFHGVLLSSTPHNILSKPLAAFPHNYCQNNGQRWERNESWDRTSDLLFSSPTATDWAMGQKPMRRILPVPSNKARLTKFCM